MISAPLHHARLKVVCIGFWADYEDYFWTRADTTRFDVAVVNVKQQARRQLIFKILPRFCRKYVYERILTDHIARHPDALFIVNEREEIVDYLHRTRPRASIAVVVRNPIATKTAWDLCCAIFMPKAIRFCPSTRPIASATALNSTGNLSPR